MLLKIIINLNTHKEPLKSSEIPTEKETNSKTTLINLDPFIIEKQAPK